MTALVAAAGRPAQAVLFALLALLLISRPDSNFVWAVNGLRSAGFVAAFTTAGAALALWLFARRGGSWRAWAVAALALVALLAFPLRERGHFLGDTEIRLRAIGAFNADMFGLSLREWAQHLHAQPLDIALDFFVPIAWQRMGHSILQGVQIVSLLLALGFCALVWRLAGRLAAPREARLAAALALALSGVLEAFAGYAESAGLLLVAGAWWWHEMLGPLDRRSRALRVLLAWLVLLLAHRQALVLLPAMVLRGWRPIHAADTRAARLTLLAGCVPALGAGILLLWASAGGGPLASDLGDLGAVLSAWTRGQRLPAPTDLFGLLILVAPLAFVAAALWRDPERGRPRGPTPMLPFAAAIVCLLPLVVTILTGPHELGAHRDWDTAVLLGFTLTLAGLSAILSLPAPRARAVLVSAVPVLALLAGGWVAVNANEAAVERRAAALATGLPRLVDEQRSAVEVFLGDREMSGDSPARGATHFERAYALAPNPRLLLLATEAHARAGEYSAARADLDRAWRSGGLNARNQESAKTLKQMIDELEKRETGP